MARSGHSARTGGSLVQRRKIARVPAEGRLVGVRRVPRSLGGGFLGALVVVLFFASLSSDPVLFMARFALLVVVVGAAVWCLVQSPLRPSFEQRWRPRRKIAVLDTSGWEAVATDLGVELSIRRRPCMRGRHRQTDWRLEYRQLGGARTMAGALLPRRERGRLVVLPRRAEFHTRHDRRTGDAGFDRGWRVAATKPELVRRYLPPLVRKWIAAVEPERVIVRGRTVTAWCPAFVANADRLRGLVELVTVMAGSPNGGAGAPPSEDHQA